LTGRQIGGRDESPSTTPLARRLFVGVPLPPEAATQIAQIVEGVRALPLPDGGRDVRWVRLDGLHLTMRFLGPTPDGLVEPTLAAVEVAARAADGPIEIELAGAGTFPPGRRPRTLWIGLSQGSQALGGLAAATEAALVHAGWPAERRPFRPHLTLARSDGLATGPLVADRLAAAMADRRIRCTIEAIGLFESITGGGPARYLPLGLRNLS
jgi:2'-5' RNA ligase